jgi:hypothetical protein
MAPRNTLSRSLHDVGLAGWFGGSLMGAIGLNGAAASARDPKERLSIAAVGWQKWTPFLLTAVGAHAVGSVGMLLGDRGRIALQKGARGPVVAKTLLTLAAAGASTWSALAGRAQADHSGEAVRGATEAGGWESSGLAAAQQQQKVAQWLVPALTGVLLVLAAQQGEMQRPGKGN